jgi:hypothetical protein
MTTPKDQKELDDLLTPASLLTPDDGDPFAPGELLDHPDPLAGTIGELTPEGLRDDPDLAPDPLGLTPDNLRSRPEGDPLGYPGDVGADAKVELPAKAKTPTEKLSDDLKETGKDLAKHIEATDAYIADREAEAAAEKEEIRAAFERVVAKRELDGDPLVLHMR